jgi:TRAP transporter TAXI family solute receptor
VEATSGPTKVRFVEIPNVSRLTTQFPYYAPAVVPILHYPGAENKREVGTFGVKATLVTTSRLDDAVVYAITKEVFDNFDIFRKLNPAFEMLTKRAMLEGLSAPVHPGALKYYREAGLK